MFTLNSIVRVLPLVALGWCQSTTTAASTSTTSVNPCQATTPAEVSITSFNWFNSTHNLDCVNRNYPSGATVCWNSTSLCAQGSSGCTCTPYCSTGLAHVAYQPLGYGPPDTISIGIGGYGTCYKQFPIAYRDYELGYGHFDCGSAADQIGFTGSSNEDTSVGTVYWNNVVRGCTVNGNPSFPRYKGSFTLQCTRDAGGNATCTTPDLPVKLPLVSWS